MFTVIIPTLWRSKRIYKLLDDLSSCDKVGEIIIIDNNSQYHLNVTKYYPKVHLLQQQVNIFVNPAWNLGVRKSKYDNICICNDDVNFSTQIFEYIEKEIWRGVIGMATENYGLKIDEDYCIESISARCWGWGCVFFIDRTNYVPIPDNLLIACGDDFLIKKVSPFVVKGLAVQTEVSTTSFSREFWGIQEQDSINFKRIL